MKEIWLPVVGFEKRYHVSNTGKVLSLNYRSSGNKKELSQCNIRGYLTVGLFNGKKQISYRVHRLIAASFLGEAPTNKHQINHKNGIKNDNRIENLEWCTHEENTIHAIETGLRYNFGENHGQAKLNRNQVIAIKASLRFGKLKQTQIASFFNVGKGDINHIHKGRLWRSVSI